MKTYFINKYKEREQFWNVNKKTGALFTAILLTVLMFNVSGCSKNDVAKETPGVEQEELQNNSSDELFKNNVKVGNDGVNGAIAPDEDVSIVADQNALKNSDMVSMSVEDMGRSDPFLPVGEQSNTVSKPKKIIDINLLPPPEIISTDNTATEIITTKVSGIMYDSYNPSAILNINNSDYLVRTGDIVNNYKVLAISKDTVTVQYGANIYKAGVGQIFNSSDINFNTISNLDSKFGGRKNTANKR